MQCFSYEKAFINHKENCITINGAQAIEMPKADDMVYFKNYHKGLAAAFVIYADFEAINEKVHGSKRNNDKSYILNHIRSTKTVDMAVRLSVVMMINIVTSLDI